MNKIAVKPVKVELDNDCPGHWVPEVSNMEKWLSRACSCIAGQTRSSSVSVRIVDESESASLNSRYRGKNQSTNVLSFSCEIPDQIADNLDTVPLGDLAICAPVVDREAQQQGKSLESHWAHLLTHGYLHLNGYQHGTDKEAEAMESIEITVLESLGYPNPYVAN